MRVNSPKNKKCIIINIWEMVFAFISLQGTLKYICLRCMYVFPYQYHGNARLTEFTFSSNSKRDRPSIIYT